MEKRIAANIPRSTEPASVSLGENIKPESVPLVVFDIPLKVVYDERLKVGFFDPDDEDSVVGNVDPEFSFRIGKHSGKIIGIDLAPSLDPL